MTYPKSGDVWRRRAIDQLCVVLRGPYVRRLSAEAPDEMWNSSNYMVVDVFNVDAGEEQSYYLYTFDTLFGGAGPLWTKVL